MEFLPADVAAGVVGGAIGTAGAIATAPFLYQGYACTTATLGAATKVVTIAGSAVSPGRCSGARMAAAISAGNPSA